jgi:predicted acylesterase/phospholipase RssA
MAADELRVALAIRGGVSLAVWMGGACRELVRLKHAAERDDAGSVYAALLDHYGYERVTIDVLAGTSAGGLNSVLLASHLLYGVPFDDELRKIWLRLGDLEGLTWSPRTPASDLASLLQGDAGFYRMMSERMHALAGTETPARVRYLRLILTATRVTSRPDRLRPSVGTVFKLGDSRAHFRFRHRDGVEGSDATVLTDFPAAPASEPALDRLAYAARSTSSFPAAFEPALVHVESATQPLGFAGLSSETGRPQPDRAPFVELVDGGVLQNIPINWSLRAIAAAPASKPVDRWLVYLQPVPPEVESDAPQGRVPRVTRTIALLRKVLAVRGGGDSLLDDRAAFEASNASTARVGALLDRGVLPRRLDALVAAGRDPATRARYANAVRRNEGRRVAALLEDPTAATAPDPYPLPGPAQSWDVSRPYPLGRLDDAGRSAALLTALRETGLPFPAAQLETFDGVSEACTTPLGVARAAALLLAWIRAVEAEVVVDPERFDDLRERAYLGRFVAEALLGVRDRCILDTVAGLAPDGAVTPADLATVASAALAHAVGTGSRPAALGGPGGGEDAWNAWAIDAFTNRGSDAGPASAGSTTTAGSTATFAAVWRSFAALVVDIATAAPAVASGFESLHEAGAAGIDSARDALIAAEIVLAPLWTDPLAPISPTGLTIVSAASRSPLDVWLGVDPSASDGDFVRSKLSGNQIGNFAAFLSARWRESDWLWGRLDAARALVEMVQRGRSDVPIDEATLEAMFVAATPGTQWAAFLADRWAGFDPEARRSPAGQIEILTERIQWEILAEEVPLVAEFEARRSGRNLPPTDAELDAASAASARLLHAPVGDPSDEIASFVASAKVVGEVGKEPVKRLLRTTDLRRAVLRLGFVGWRVVQPAGDAWARVARALFALLKPLVLLPVLLGITAPLTTLAAGLLSWCAVAVVGAHWIYPPAHVLVAAGIGLAATSSAWQYVGTRVAPIVVAVVSLGGVVAVAAVGVRLPMAFVADWSDAVRVVVVAALCLAATALPIRSLAGPPRFRSRRRDGSASHVTNPGWWRHLGTVAAASVAAAGVGACAAALAVWQGVPGWALLVVYAPLVAESVVLTFWFPPPPDRSGA